MKNKLDTKNKWGDTCQICQEKMHKSTWMRMLKMMWKYPLLIIKNRVLKMSATFFQLKARKYF